jgi:hypothetical protein
LEVILKQTLLIILIFVSLILNAEESTTKKRKVIKTVTTYEEVDDDSTDVTQTSHKTVKTNSPSSQYAKKSESHVDVFMGLSHPTGNAVSELKSRLGLGAEILFETSNDLTVGAFFSTNTGYLKDYSNYKYTLTYYGLVSQLKLNSTLFLMGRLGLSTISASGTYIYNGYNESFSIISSAHPYIISAGAGALFPITKDILFAPHILYTHSLSYTATTNDYSSFDSYGLLEMMGALQFNF